MIINHLLLIAICLFFFLFSFSFIYRDIENNKFYFSTGFHVFLLYVSIFCFFFSYGENMDDLGDRMKSDYENRTRYYLPRRTHTIIRIDGKSFHTYTRDLDKPYDKDFNFDMDMCAQYLLEEAQGGLFVYTQSDEISIVLQDFVKQDTQAWFNGNLQKICSISASLVTAMFNSRRCNSIKGKYKIACFDARAFTIADPAEVANYFVWRTRDAVRNSINMLCQQYFSHSELQYKNTTQVQDMLVNFKNINWNDCDSRFKTGSLQTKDGFKTIPTHNLYEFYSELLKKSMEGT